MKISERLLEKLSGKLNEVHDPKLQEELTSILASLVREVKEDNYEYFRLVRKLAELQMNFERVEKGREQAEYDKEYFRKMLGKEE